MFRYCKIRILYACYTLALLQSGLVFAGQEASDFQSDTAHIRHLFKQGNRFINGPSDSLLFYYSKALESIRDRLQKTPVDTSSEKSLYRVIRKLEFRALVELGIEYFFRADYQQALSYEHVALGIARQMNDEELLSEVYSEIGIIYKNQGKFDEALSYYEQALRNARFGNDTSWIASCEVNIGNVYKKKSFFSIALTYYLKALSILENMGHDKRVAACYQNIGDIYEQQNDYQKALDYYSKAIFLAQKTRDKIRETTCYMNIGHVYANQNNLDTARQNYNKAFALFQQTGYRHELDYCKLLMGDSYMKEGKPGKALSYYIQAFELARKENDHTVLAEVLINMGRAYAKQKNYSKALSLTRQGLEQAMKFKQLTLTISAHQALSEIYESLGLIEQSLAEWKAFNFYKDSLFTVNKYKAITEMEMKYQLEKKEKEMVVLKAKNEVQQYKLSKRNRLYIASMIVFGLLLILAYILFRNHRLKTKHRAIELEQKLIRSQMNPHFIFNSLIAIQSFIYKQDAVVAGDYLAKFADLIRITLENTRVDMVLIAKELKMLSAYLELQKLRFEAHFTYHIHVDASIDPDGCLIPPMMAQPFIENAIEHGLRYKAEKGFVRINFEKKQKTSQCTIEDNGVGRARAKAFEKHRQHQSLDTGINRERLFI